MTWTGTELLWVSWSSRLLLRLSVHSDLQSANEMETHDEHDVNPHEER